MAASEQLPDPRARDDDRTVRWQLIGIVGIGVLVAVGVVAWILDASVVNHWLAVHTGTVNESGPYSFAFIRARVASSTAYSASSIAPNA
jgi:hypothetical protein